MGYFLYVPPYGGCGATVPRCYQQQSYQSQINGFIRQPYRPFPVYRYHPVVKDATFYARVEAKSRKQRELRETRNEEIAAKRARYFKMKESKEKVE